MGAITWIPWFDGVFVFHGHQYTKLHVNNLKMEFKYYPRIIAKNWDVPKDASAVEKDDYQRVLAQYEQVITERDMYKNALLTLKNKLQDAKKIL